MARMNEAIRDFGVPQRDDSAPGIVAITTSIEDFEGGKLTTLRLWLRGSWCDKEFVLSPSQDQSPRDRGGNIDFVSSKSDICGFFQREEFSKGGNTPVQRGQVFESGGPREKKYSLPSYAERYVNLRVEIMFGLRCFRKDAQIVLDWLCDPYPSAAFPDAYLCISSLRFCQVFVPSQQIDMMGWARTMAAHERRMASMFPARTRMSTSDTPATDSREFVAFALLCAVVVGDTPAHARMPPMRHTSERPNRGYGLLVTIEPIIDNSWRKRWKGEISPWRLDNITKNPNMGPYVTHIITKHLPFGYGLMSDGVNVTYEDLYGRHDPNFNCVKSVLELPMLHSMTVPRDMESTIHTFLEGRKGVIKHGDLLIDDAKSRMTDTGFGPDSDSGKSAHRRQHHGLSDLAAQRRVKESMTEATAKIQASVSLIREGCRAWGEYAGDAGVIAQISDMATTMSLLATETAKAISAPP